LDSLYVQDLPEDDFEVICVNDCSTDNTRDVILSYAAKHPNLALIDHTENLTAGGARNTGIQASKGEYIWFVDPDDAIKPDSLQELYAKAKGTGVDILFFNYDDADENLKVLREDKTYPDSGVCNGQEFVLKYFKDKFATFGIIWREIYRAGFLRETGIRYPVMRKAQDVVFLWKVMLRAERVCSVSKAYYTYRSNPYSVTKHQTVAKVAFSDRILRAAEIVRMLEKNEVHPDLAKDMLRSARWCANSNMEVIGQMSKEERARYYDEMDRHRDAIKVVAPYMNRKHRILFGMSLGKLAWLAKAGLMCKLDRKKHS
jgi:glycosyltransferase involved in cell wall biosynthesis